MTDLIDTVEALRATYGAPSPLAARAKADRLDELTRAFIARSPFVVIGSADAAGNQDVSPRGDAPGFVRVLDDRTLAIPDRPGNNKLETFSNLLERPQLALLFMIPGHDETLRIAGRGRLSTEPELLRPSAVDGKSPRAVLLVTVECIYPHCGKAFRRAGLWQAAGPAKGEVPSLARIAKAMTEDAISVEALEARLEEGYRSKLY